MRALLLVAAAALALLSTFALAAAATGDGLHHVISGGAYSSDALELPPDAAPSGTTAWPTNWPHTLPPGTLTPPPPPRHQLRGIVSTTHGNIVLVFYPHAAPKTVANWVRLARSGFFNGRSYFYRYVAGFVVQGGGYYANQTSNSTVPLEYKLPNEQWTIGLARGDTTDSGSSEWYINVANNSKTLAPGGSSKHGYCVFGRVVSGFSTVRALMMLPTHMSQADGTTEFNKPWPLIKSVKII